MIKNWISDQQPEAVTAVKDPGWRIGRIVAAALVLLHHENDRTT